MTRALVLTHFDIDGRDELADWLTEAGLELDVLRLHVGGAVPASLEAAGAAVLVVMGGPQAAYDDDVPWLADELALIRGAVEAGAPVLGVCLGAQLLARATGGRVARAERAEVGPALVARRDAAAMDPVFHLVPFTPDVVQYHGDEVVELPPGAVLLASGLSTQVQAFRVGRRAYGLQFHVEAGVDTVARWTREEPGLLERAGTDAETLLAGVAAVHADLVEVWRPAAHRFAALATGSLVGQDLLA
ncbi:MAG: type 1 glutamine amidotransferase [Actinomycetota bacterium]|nr:type 1 glutamine amidotransferase [Actinomycetota bacterium]